MRTLAATIILVLAALLAQTGTAQAADAEIRLLDMFIGPADTGSMNKLEGNKWPTVRELSALLRVELAGYSGERDLEMFFVVYDREGEVVVKEKQRHPLPAGNHDIVVPDFMHTADFFGRHSFSCEVELSLKGADTTRGGTSFDVEGPEPPKVEIRNIQVFNPAGGYRDNYFEPGSTFAIETVINISENHAGTMPQITVYAVMEEDALETLSDGNYQTYYEQWETGASQYSSGQFRMRAFGNLPHYFAEPWERFHPFRVYVQVSFGPGAITGDYSYEQLYDPVGGDIRQTDEIEQRLIEITPAYNWEFRRGREQFEDIDQR